MDLNEIAIYIKVVESGSFTKAALQLGMPKSTVSLKISELENRLGISLIKRTTRKLFVTEEGRFFYEQARPGLDKIRMAQDEIMKGLSEPQGMLRITAPVELGNVILPKVIEKYRQRYPKVTFELHFSDRRVDLVGEGFDLAIRAGHLKDSSLMAKKVGEAYFAPFATQGYLNKKGTPVQPKDLLKHDCLQFKSAGWESWKLVSGKQIIDVPIESKIEVNDLNALKSLAVKGMGVAMLPTFMCGLEVKGGQLVRLMDKWKTNMVPIHFVYPGSKNTSPKVSSFIELGTDVVKGYLNNLEQEMGE